MELRDFIALATAGLAFVSFIWTTIQTRIWAEKVAYRDELARFAEDAHVKDVFTPNARLAARQASVYLSLELAEIARRSASKQAIRASSGFVRRVILYGIGSIAAITLFVYAALIGWEQRSLISNLAGAAYFGIASLSVAGGYVKTIRDLRRVRQQTGQLQELRRVVAKADPLTSRDARLRPQGSASTLS